MVSTAPEVVTEQATSPLSQSAVEPIILRPPESWLTNEAAMLELWELNPEWDIEVTDEGWLEIMPGTGRRNSRNAIWIAAQILEWGDAHGESEVHGADGMVRFPPPSRAMMAPDVSWVSKERLAEAPESHETSLILVCPDFVVELRSENDDIEAQQGKMKRWIDHGVRLGWLIDVYHGQAWIYRSEQDEPEMRERPAHLEGERVLPGLIVHLERIWE